MRQLIVVAAAALALGGCASTPATDAGVNAVERSAARGSYCETTPISRMSARMRDRCTRVQSVDTSIMRQQIHPCSGGVCGR